jgi:hypothetical protein
VRVVAGQVVTSTDTLFNIVDPKSLWVEAISFDPRIVDGGEKVGHGSGGVVLPRGALKGSQWLA